MKASAPRARRHLVTKFRYVAESPTERVVINKGVVIQAQFAPREAHNCTTASDFLFYTLIRKVREMVPNCIKRLRKASKSLQNDWI